MSRPVAGGQRVRAHLSGASNNATASPAQKSAAATSKAPEYVDGVRVKSRFTIAQLKDKLRDLLGLLFTLSDVQAETIRRLDMGYDVICVMGTGYGKSVIYEGLAALNKKSVIIVICPLKALEYDQVAQAEAKGLSACALNEDTLDEPEKEREILTLVGKGKKQLVYVSPEMALQPKFLKLLRDSSLRTKLKAIIVDECHVIPEWAEEFRTAYGELCQLRSHSGDTVPWAAFSATLTTEDFNVVWNTLQFGRRPFWGVDAGVVRPNLTYLVKRREKADTPCMNALSFIPDDLDNTSPASEVPKTMFYFETQDDCIDATHIIRRCLPEPLRASAVHPFSSIASTEAKAKIWDEFSGDTCRVLCATDAAGMGCNVPDIEICAVFDLKGPKDFKLTLPRLCQRWGRTGRGKDTEGLCILYVPDWAFRPEPLAASALPAIARVQSKSSAKKDQLEPPTWTAQRNNLQTHLEQFINLAHKSNPKLECAHAFVSRVLRPDTGLDTHRELDLSDKPSKGWRHTAFSATWVVLDLRSPAPRDRCCWVCNPILLDCFHLVSPDDGRFTKFARDFLLPLPSQPVGCNTQELSSPTRSEASHGSQRLLF